MNKIIRGLQIIKEYEDSTLSAEHDIIYIWARNVSEKDEKELEELGWSHDEPNHWFTFV